MNFKDKKICVVGAGNWGFNHIKTLHAINALGGVVELNPENKNKVKNQFPEIKIFSSIDESFEQNFLGYTIATPVPTHYSLAKKIINKGYSVLIEKPMTLNASEAEDLIKLSKSRKVNIMVGHVLLFHPAIQKIKDLIDCNKIGRLQYIYSNRLNLGKVRTEEDVFWSFAPHDISIMQYLTDSYPLEINTTGGAFLQNEVYDTTITTLAYPGNIKAHIYLSWLHPFKEHRIVVIGSEGMISFEDSSKNKPLKFYDKKYAIKNNVPEKHDGEVVLIDYPMLAPLEEEMKYFIQNIEKDSFQIAGSQNGLEVIKILEQASSRKKEI